MSRNAIWYVRLCFFIHPVVVVSNVCSFGIANSIIGLNFRKKRKVLAFSYLYLFFTVTIYFKYTSHKNNPQPMVSLVAFMSKSNIHFRF